MARPLSQPARRRRLRGGERALPLAAVALIALHVVDDTLLQPPPGTSAGDHLAAAAVPLALLALAGAGIAALGSPGRWWVAAAAGVLGVVTGVEAAWDGVSGTLSGDDATGLVALAAGLLLLALAGRGIWRGRRRDRPLGRAVLVRAGIGALVAVAAYVVVLPLAIGYGATHIADREVPPPDLGAPAREVRLGTADGLDLAGWYVPSRNRAAVVALGMSGDSARDEAAMLVRHGYGVLALSQRGWGDSEGAPNAYGWHGALDVAAAVRWLRARPEVDPGRVGGLGLSVGGEMMITAAAQTPGLAAVVSEGAGERSVREFAEIASGAEWLSLPTSAMTTAWVAIFAGRAPPPSLADLAARVAPRPLLLVYGERGQEFERRLNPVYAAAAGRTATLWEVPGSGHIEGLETAPAEYERRVVGFLDAALRPERPPAGRATAPPPRAGTGPSDGVSTPSA